MKSRLSWFIVISGATILCYYGFWSGSQKLSDFAAYYTSARILVTTDSISHIYEDDWFINVMHSYGIPDSTIIMFVNPPSVTLIMTPLVWLEPTNAKTVWNLINLVFILIAFKFLQKLYNLSLDSSNTVMIFALTICTVPVLRNLQLGQVYPLIVILLIIFVQSYINKQPVLTSLSLAILLLLKYFGWMFFILFIMERRRKELWLTLLIFLAGFFATLFIVGGETYEAHLKLLKTTLCQNTFAFTGLPSIPSFYGGLFTFHSQWNPNPVANLSWLAPILTTSSFIIMIILSFKKTSINNLSRLSVIIILSVIFTPLAAEHHYLLLTLPAAYFILNEKSTKNDAMSKLIYLGVIYFVLGWFPQQLKDMEAGWAKLIAFPRLYAAVFLWFLILHPNLFRKFKV